MRRLASTLRLDSRVQNRNKLYVIGIGVALIVGATMGRIFPHETIRTILPVIFLGSLGGTTYMFVAGMVLFEKSERTHHALSVTPLRRREYILSKTITLSAFVTVESAILLFLAFGFRGFDAARLAAGIVSMGALYTLVGMAQVARHDSVTEFLVPGAVLISSVLQLPALHLLEIFPSPVWYLIPTQAQALMIKGALQPIPAWEWVYAVGYTLVALSVAWVLAERRISRYVLGAGAVA